MTITDLTTATPVEIDTVLAEIYGRIYKAQARRDDQWESVRYAVKRFLGLGYRQEPTTQQMRDVITEAVEFGADGTYQSQQVWQAEAEYQDLCQAVDSLWFETAPYSEEFTRRGGWTRAFLVKNVNGHVHSSMNCSTCFPTTQYAWIVEYSGGTENQVVEDAGERACTVCYPSAPVDVLKRATKIFSDDEKAAQKAREERAAAKVQQEQKRLEKALLPSGEPLAVVTGNNGRGYEYKERFVSLVSAKSWLTSSQERWAHVSSYPQSAISIVAEAVAAKEGKSVETVLAEAKTRAAKRK